MEYRTTLLARKLPKQTKTNTKNIKPPHLYRQMPGVTYKQKDNVGKSRNKRQTRVSRLNSAKYVPLQGGGRRGGGSTVRERGAFLKSPMLLNDTTTTATP